MSSHPTLSQPPAHELWEKMEKDIEAVLKKHGCNIHGFSSNLMKFTHGGRVYRISLVQTDKHK